MSNACSCALSLRISKSLVSTSKRRRRRRFCAARAAAAGLQQCGADAGLLALLLVERHQFRGEDGEQCLAVAAAPLLGSADAGERLLLVEDSAELRPDHPHVVRLEARPPNMEGAWAAMAFNTVPDEARVARDLPASNWGNTASQSAGSC